VKIAKINTFPCVAVHGFSAENESHAGWATARSSTTPFICTEAASGIRVLTITKTSDSRRRRRSGGCEGRPAHSLREGNEPGQPPSHDARSCGGAFGFVHGQHRAG
jgi:hypothetical protein